MPLFGPSGAPVGTQTPTSDTRSGAAGSSTSVSPQDHAHQATALWLPADSGWLGWTFDPILATGNAGTVAGNVHLCKILLPAAISVTNVTVRIFSYGAGMSNTYCGLYTSAGSLVGTTADQSTPWASGATLKQMALTGGPFTVGPGFVWAAVQCGAGATQPKLLTLATVDTTLNNGTLAAAASRSGTISNSTTLPSSFTPSTITQASIIFWVGLS